MTGEATYRDAAAFVEVALGWSERHAGAGFAAPLLDSATVDHPSPPCPSTSASVYGLDVDPAVTALTQTTLPGVQSLTVPSHRPAVVGDRAAETINAFTVLTPSFGRRARVLKRRVRPTPSPAGVAVFTRVR
jgi:hypothetical protein